MSREREMANAQPAAVVKTTSSKKHVTKTATAAFALFAFPLKRTLFETDFAPSCARAKQFSGARNKMKKESDKGKKLSQGFVQKRVRVLKSFKKKK